MVRFWMNLKSRRSCWLYFIHISMSFSGEILKLFGTSDTWFNGANVTSFSSLNGTIWKRLIFPVCFTNTCWKQKSTQGLGFQMLFQILESLDIIGSPFFSINDILELIYLLMTSVKHSLSIPVLIILHLFHCDLILWPTHVSWQSC